MTPPITIEGPYRCRRRLLRARIALALAAALLLALPFATAALAVWARG